jgi:hypothetical protein
MLSFQGGAVADQDDVRRIARALPGVHEAAKGFAFCIVDRGKEKGFVWVWMQRLAPRKPKAPNPEVLAVRVADQGEKAMLLAGAPEKFFTEPHYDGFPAVLVRLPAVTETELKKLIFDAWQCLARQPSRRAPGRRAGPRGSPSKARAAASSPRAPRRRG